MTTWQNLYGFKDSLVLEDLFLNYDDDEHFLQICALDEKWRCQYCMRFLEGEDFPDNVSYYELIKRIFRKFDIDPEQVERDREMQRQMMEERDFFDSVGFDEPWVE